MSTPDGGTVVTKEMLWAGVNAGPTGFNANYAEYVYRAMRALAPAAAIGEERIREFAEAIFGSWISKDASNDDGKFGCDHCSIRFDDSSGWMTIKHDDYCVVEKAKAALATKEK